MVLDINPHSIVHEPDLQRVEWYFQRCAMEMALFGEVDAARDLVSLFLKSGVAPRWAKHVSVARQALTWAWEETGQWPEGSFEKDRSSEAISQLRKSYEESCWGMVPEELRDFDERELEACLRDWGNSLEVLSPPHGLPRLVKALDVSLMRGTRDPDSNLPCTNVETQTKETTVRHDDDDISIAQAHENDNHDWVKVSFIDNNSNMILAHIISRWATSHQFEYLVQAERLWPWYIIGLFANAMGIEKRELQLKSHQLVAAFAERLQSGHAKTTLASKSIRELLEIGERNTLRGLEDGQWHEKLNPRPTGFFKKSADKSEIDALEERLGVSLPNDYREFLQISNGFGHDERGIHDGILFAPALFGTENVSWNAEEWFQLPVDLLHLPHQVMRIGNR